jgi:hypothetical protein
MFDTSMSTRNVQTVNAVSGTLIKSHPKSYFMWGHADSTNTDLLMGRRSDRVVLQAMLIGDMYLMYEVVDKDDYELRGDA